MSDSVQVTQQVGPSTTRYTLTGPQQAMQEKIDSLLRQYDPWGYGTTVQYIESGAIVTRSNSCE